MWTKNSDNNRWYKKVDTLDKDNFDSIKQDIEKVRLYSKCLSGSTYVATNDINDIYDILSIRDQYNWFIDTTGSVYSIASAPNNPKSIDSTTSEEFYNKYSFEYGLTLKNKFTPVKLITDTIDNFLEVDVATVEALTNIGSYQPGLTLDGVILKDGHRVLIKDQKDTIDLLSSVNPDDYFNCNYGIEEDNGSTIKYSYFNSDNGIYKYTNNILVRETDLDSYSDAYKYSVSVKLGDTQVGNQFHLARLKDGYYPLYQNGDPVEFELKNNWVLRNRVDYNNIYEISYVDIASYTTHSYIDNGYTYVIPKRAIAIGEFGMIVVYQDGISNVINNKYKVNLNSISETNKYYWICGDEGTLLRMSKLDFDITRIKIDEFANLTSIDFLDDLRGFVVGKFNTVYYTQNGGYNWSKILKNELEGLSYNKVVYTSINKAYIGGESGVFIELSYINNEWIFYKRKISKYLDTEEPTEEYLLVDDIKDMYFATFSLSEWGLTYSSATSSLISDNKESLFISTNGGNILVHDINDFVPNFDFIYLSFTSSSADINSITKVYGSSSIYFSSDNVYKLDISKLGVISGTSNTVYSTYSESFQHLEYDKYVNKIFDYQGENLFLCGNNSTLYYTGYTPSIYEMGADFNNRYKSKFLFLDYEIGSKLNFFDDTQNYRLPNSLTFSESEIGAYLAVKNLEGEYNWLTYYKDREKTFTYYTSMDGTNQVLFSTTFSQAYSYFTITSSDINIDPDVIKILAPNIDSTTASRYISESDPIAGVTNAEKMYLHRYLMVFKQDGFYPCDVGDVMYIECDVIRATFVVNYIFNHGFDKYLYCFVDFNQGVVNDLKAFTGTIGVTNLNKYSGLGLPTSSEIIYGSIIPGWLREDEVPWNYDDNISPDDYFAYAPLSNGGENGDLLINFNLHPVSYGYKLTIDSNNIFTLAPKYNNKTAYYNMQSSIIVESGAFTMSYTDAFMKFGYKPTYNIYDYLSSIDDTVFLQSKKFLAMPEYASIPGNDGDDFTENNIFIDTGGFPTNKIMFGSNLEFEWNSIWVNTFVDVTLYTASTSYLSERMLVTNKYIVTNVGSLNLTGYVIEFNKRLSYIDGDNITYIDILSRNTLKQISDDLQTMNNIHRSDTVREVKLGDTFDNLENELFSKVPTDSYAKVLLSDKDIKDNLSSMIFVDDKNELAMTVIRLQEDYDIQVKSTGRYTVGSTDYLLITCSQSVDLSVGDPVSISFNGDENSSNYLNKNFFGYQTIQGIVDSFSFYTYKEFDGVDISPVDPGNIKYSKRDPFFNFEPVDIMDVGVDKQPKKAVEILPDNVFISSSRYYLSGLDFNNYRYQLVDGISVIDIYNKYPWVLESEISKAVMGQDSNGLVWYMGDWKCGRWFGGTWMSGRWISGDWYKGIWNSYESKYKLLNVNVNKNLSDSNYSKWYNGRWFNGTWNNGSWYNGRRYDGDWNNGIWYNGVWNDGVWNNGEFKGGIWVRGDWNNGQFNCDNKPSYWIDGNWYGGDFGNGIWYNGQFLEKNGNKSRFGTKAFNTRTATWHSGRFSGGEFHSYLNTDEITGESTSSLFNKYSIWNTGIWNGGTWYGGVAYAIDFNSGVWWNGVIEEIQIVGIEIVDGQLSKFTLNGIFKFNPGDDVWVTDSTSYFAYSIIGSHQNPGNYKVLMVTEIGERTIITIDKDLYSITGAISVNEMETGLRLTAIFKNSTWKSGVWTNGIFDGGYFEGGIWYGGLFTANWGI